MKIQIIRAEEPDTNDESPGVTVNGIHALEWNSIRIACMKFRT